ncbi:conjugal transfer protein TraB [Chryseobacterium pennae]|uniref:Conjugal transfer protein TraB n=1 Tax=Chryseobacterium pennae TaxID=2258962 RepID=A0A3D9C8D7_9FLAO|nr:DUF3408 domain-containing protein [Chryseobacterium pennae]REC61846.1 conjugal transfer protein TraB [Chryseobacterium pennae]
MAKGKGTGDTEKSIVDEDYLMNIMSGDEAARQNGSLKQEENKENYTRGRSKASASKKVDYEETFLINRFPSGRNGKVVYIRSEFHERLLRVVQLTREDKVTLYSYIDNILEYHFREFGEDITSYFNERFKPII